MCVALVSLMFPIETIYISTYARQGAQDRTRSETTKVQLLTGAENSETASPKPLFTITATTTTTKHPPSSGDSL